VTEPGRRLCAILFTDLVGYTALMGADEARALRAVERMRARIRERVEAHGGHFVEAEGDGTLSTFASAVEAATCAREVQETLRGDEDVSVRIGLHVGDVLEADGHVYGDGVNVAARIRALAEPGAICMSEPVQVEVRNKPGFAARPLGEQRLKNVDRPVAVWTLDPDGPGRPAPRRLRRALFGATGALVLGALALGLAPDLRIRVAAAALAQLPFLLPAPIDRQVSFTRSADGTRIAWASIGEGPAIVRVLTWSTHIDLEQWGWRDMIEALTRDHRYVHYDGRGFGLSQRGVEHSDEVRLEDLEAVVDAAGLERFSLLGISAGTATAIIYAARHPERVERLVLYGTILSFADLMGGDADTSEAMVRLARQHWGTDDPLFRDFFSGVFAPDATDFQRQLFVELTRRSAERRDIGAFFESTRGGDARADAARVRAPTLLIHRREDRLIPFESGLEAASLIPGARLLALGGKNHIFLPGEEEGPMATAAMVEFFTKRGAETR
jgi:class 3 adenylate cyclase/pimeloyl-ACP methyl ester carboxylesterase